MIIGALLGWIIAMVIINVMTQKQFMIYKRARELGYAAKMTSCWTCIFGLTGLYTGIGALIGKIISWI